MLPGRTPASACGWGVTDGTARVYDATGTGRPVQLSGHQHSVYWAEFSPDGQHVVTASFDKTARIHRADGTGEPIVLAGHTDMVFSASYSPLTRYYEP